MQHLECFAYTTWMTLRGACTTFRDAYLGIHIHPLHLHNAIMACVSVVVRGVPNMKSIFNVPQTFFADLWP